MKWLFFGGHKYATILIRIFFSSRQIYVLGDHAMTKLVVSDVLIVGVGALGIEIGNYQRQTFFSRCVFIVDD
jgi:hypothetical protein